MNDDIGDNQFWLGCWLIVGLVIAVIFTAGFIHSTLTFQAAIEAGMEQQTSGTSYIWVYPE